MMAVVLDERQSQAGSSRRSLGRGLPAMGEPGDCIDNEYMHACHQQQEYAS